MFDTYVNYILPKKQPKLSVVWIRDPDTSQHTYGVGSANAVDGLHSNDRMLGQLRAKLQELGKTAQPTSPLSRIMRPAMSRHRRASSRCGQSRTAVSAKSIRPDIQCRVSCALRTCCIAPVSTFLTVSATLTFPCRLASRRTALRCIRPSSTLTGNFAGMY
jgi:Type I phosphodiesterase / nucleotide pyrophosphatase